MSLLALLFMSFTSHAYIPEYSLLASHAAEQHGKGAYLIEQEVIYRKEAEAYAVKETWTVVGESAMRVTLEGRGPLKGLVQGTILFEGAQKAFVDPMTGGTRLQRLGEDWLDPLFTFRSSKYLRARLMSLHVTPVEAGHDRPPLPTEGEMKYEAPSFIRLSRVGGAIAWAIGVPPVGNTVNPTLWLEQDQFVVRKFRGADQTVLHANDYVKYDDGLWFPRQRIYSFGNYNIEVQTTRVKSLGKVTADAKGFKTSSLSAKDALKLPDADGLKEFYSRFR